MAVARAFAAALGREQTGSPARLGAVRVARAFHALALLATGGPSSLSALGVVRTLDARAARQIAQGTPRLAVGGAGTRPQAAAPREIAARAPALGVARTLHAAPVAQIADAVRALVQRRTLHAGSAALLAKGPAWLRAVSIARAVDAAPPAVAGRAPRLGAVGVEQALNAHVELGAALGQGLPGAMARLRARRRARREHGVTGSVAAAFGGRAALRAHVAHARGPSGPAVDVEQTLDARATRALPSSRTIARDLALERCRARAGREHVERAPLIQVAAQQNQHAERAGRGASSGAHGPSPIRLSASSRAKPSGWRAR